jgi:thiamine-monophosphate kinase
VALTEFELIRRYFTRDAPGARIGVGDDAAVLAARRGTELVVTTDLLLAGRHFERDAEPRALGHKALAVNLSDLAAMGAVPRWATLALALPRADPRWLAAFSAGFFALARRHRVDLVGGDTTRGPLAICVQAIGELPQGTALTRAGARPGDDVWVSGRLGDAALALAARRGGLRLGARERALAARRLERPEPRVALGVRLRGIASAAIDVSDGLLADLGHICERSRVSAVIELARIPCLAALRARLSLAAARAALLAGGDDYELCFTAPPGRRAAVERAAAAAGTRVSRIGAVERARARAPVTVLDEEGRPVRTGRAGFDHFA